MVHVMNSARNSHVPDALNLEGNCAINTAISYVRSRFCNASLSSMTSKSSKPLSASSFINLIIPCHHLVSLMLVSDLDDIHQA
jgi:hypothetical protein